jgi:hypothetical protein
MAKRRPLTKAELLGRLHPGLRPKLAAHQVRDLALAHIANLDAISRGEGTEDLLWQWIGGALTWSYVAAELHRRNPDAYAEAAAAMQQQLATCEAVINRYGRSGRIGFSGLEYQQAKEACCWMDALAEVVDRPTAVAAADWSEARLNQLAAESTAKRAEGRVV